VNGGILDDPRATILINDGRNHVVASKKEYDVIISQPSNPWISGVNNLFTLEAFRLFQNRLSPGGLACQWIQYYEMRPEDLFSLLRTFAEVFAHVDVFRAARGDLLLVGSSRPFPFDREEIDRRMHSSPNEAIFRTIGLSEAADLLASYLFTIERERENDAWKAVRDFPLNRDDNMLIEFSMPRHMEEPRLEENRAALAHLHDRSKVHRAAPHRHLELARGAVKLWDLPVAELELALAATEENPDIAGIHSLRARILLLRSGWEGRPGLVGEAERETEIALGADSTSSEAHFLLGAIALQRSAWAEAVRSLQKAIELGEDPGVAYVYLGRALEEDGRFDEAVDAYSRALRERPNNRVAQDALQRVRSHLQ